MGKMFHRYSRAVVSSLCICKRFTPSFFYTYPWVLFHPLILYSFLPLNSPPIHVRYVQLDELPFELVSVRLTGNRSIPSSTFCSLDLLEKKSSTDLVFHPVQIGGEWSPQNCTPHFQVAIILPYRNRSEHLQTFLAHIHPFLQAQNIAYKIVVVEQTNKSPFNRGKLFNIGFTENERLSPTPCYIFHDVDLLPEKVANLYACSHQPRHLSVAVNTLRYTLLYDFLFGGVTALTSKTFRRLNGYWNSFYGWGGEDDEFSLNLLHHGLDIVRLEPSISRYRMLHHERDIRHPDRRKVIREWKTSILPYREKDGLKGLRYHVLKQEMRPTYTWYLVDL